MEKNRNETWTDTGGVEAHFIEPKIWQMWDSQAKHIANNDLSLGKIRDKRDLHGRRAYWNMRNLCGQST